MSVEISQGEFDLKAEVPILMTEAEVKLYQHRGQVYALLLGQYAQLLQDKLNHDATWSSFSASYDPLELYKFMEKVILKQTEDHYAHAAVAEKIIYV